MTRKIPGSAVASRNEGIFFWCHNRQAFVCCKLFDMEV